MTRYYVKAPITGWHEVSKEAFERFVLHLRKDATPVIPIDELIKNRTRIETDATPGPAV